jgi:SAM-dependent methyltransferase
MSLARKLSQLLLPRSVRRGLVRATLRPPVGTVRFGSLRRNEPISRDWGFERGNPIDRFYIERFLDARRETIRGRVLEVAENRYTRLFGEDRVTRSDVLHLEDRPGATIVADLTAEQGLPAGAFDCVICTQTLQFVYDVPAAVRGIHRALAPGGTALVTIPGISQISVEDMEQWGDFWRFTTASAHRLFGEVFSGSEVHVEAQGNVLASIAFLHGIAAGELSEEELVHHDPQYQLLISVLATRG